MPPNQLAQVRSRTPGVLRIASAWLVGIGKISDVDRIVTIRVDELASAPALKPSITARSEANRNTAIATLITVRSVRRLLRRALFSTSPMNFIANFFPLAAGPHPRRALTLMPRLGFSVLGSAWPQALFHWRRGPTPAAH